MSIFKRDEVVDLTQLKKLGLLKVKEEKTGSVAQKIQGGYVDIFALNKPAENQQTSPSQTPAYNPQNSTTENPLSFFDNFSANSAPQISQENPQEKNKPDNSDFAIKLENLEYQLERLVEKLSLIESKVQKFEEKVSN